MATAAQVAEYRSANQALVSLAQRELSDFWGSLNLSGDPTLVRNALLEFFPSLVTAFGDTAAVLGADWYDMLRNAPASAASFRAVVAQPVSTVQASETVRWAVGPLFEGDWDAALSRLVGSAQRLVMQPGRESVFESVSRDSVRTLFARVPSGATTCRWCVMLASRGFDYSSAKAAGEARQFHDNCDCVVVPGGSKADLPEDYDLELFERLYQQQSGLGRDLS